MTLGHLGQFNQIHCDSRKHEVLSVNYVLISGHVFGIDCVWSLELHIFNFIVADILDSEIFWKFWAHFLFLSSFSAILLGDVIA